MLAILATLALARCPAPPDEWDGLRSRIASAGDVDRDGTPDLLVADREAELGTVWVLDGRDGCPLVSVLGEAPGDGFGCSLSAAGDVDGDGHADFIVGAWPVDGPRAASTTGVPAEVALVKAGLGPAGQVLVFSGRDGTLLHRLTSGAASDGFGACAVGGGDLDGDGWNDVAVASNSSVYVFSGRSGEVLGSAEGEWLESSLCLWRGPDGGREAELVITHRSGRVEARRGPGLEKVLDLAQAPGLCMGRPPWALAAGGDADGDGFADLVVSFIHCGVAVISGFTLEPLHLLAPYELGSRVDMSAAGSSVDWIGDVDGDGRDDFVVASNESERIRSPSPGFAHVYSGRTGELLRSYEPARKRLDACRAGDADRDGIPDVAVFVEEDDVVRVLAGGDLRTLWERRLDDLKR